MKVLFAVNNENISESIIKKYQKDYKEILTYKNVYYFNAILKELQKDKSYDRIVISEDLEPFANNNYDIIDKFIFEKLDKISDEATDATGNDTPIILICTDRRSKADGILVKLFGIGVYSAIIGQDRSIDEVCRLIYMPRTKKESKLYYRIEADEVTYKTENESNVSEVEIQNILAHYKRLGKNTERYVDSFNNIAAQYTDSQLKLIAKFLPLNVKAVLESESPKYQELMVSGDKGSKKQSVKYGTPVNSKAEQKEKNKKTAKNGLELDAFESKNLQTNLTSSVVIPSAVNTAKPTKVGVSEQPKNVEPLAFKAPIQHTQEQVDESEIEIEGLEEDFEEINEIPEIEMLEPVEEVIEPIKKGRGRPKKIVPESEIETEPKVKKGRGRPRKIVQEELEDISEDLNEVQNNPAVSLYDIGEEDDEEEFIEPTPTTSTNDGINLFDLDDEEEDDEETLDDYNVQTQPNIQPKQQINSRPAPVKPVEESYSGQNFNDQFVPEQEYVQVQEQEEVAEDGLNLQNNKIVSFVGTTKNGTSFLINNLALMFSAQGIKTAILDLTTNKNSYYIFTKNDEELRRKAMNSFADLNQGLANGIEINKFLTSYTSLPGEKIQNLNYNTVIQTLRNNYQLVLIDCDFTTTPDAFKNSNEIYIVQSMDILTIQPLTAFMRDLKTAGVLDQEKLRLIINKYQKLRGLTDRMLVGGLSSYNDPAMSFMTELFNKETIKYVNIPLDVGAYTTYIEGLVTCELSTRGFSRGFSDSLSILQAMIYPIQKLNDYSKKNKKGKKEEPQGTTFNANMNNTLNQMKNTRY